MQDNQPIPRTLSSEEEPLSGLFCLLLFLVKIYDPPYLFVALTTVLLIRPKACTGHGKQVNVLKQSLRRCGSQ